MKTTFINRVSELAWLESCYKKADDSGQLLIIYGKRRVGKTELVTQFLRGKPSIYYVANRTTKIEQLASATQVFSTGLGDTFMAPAGLASWRDFFDYLIQKVENRKDAEPLVLVFDEYPYLAESEAGTSSFFQYGWDMGLKDQRVLLIVMGSSIAMMQKHALVKSTPLYGRRTGQWLVEPFGFTETQNFYPNSSFENSFSLYAISGGIPAYASIFDGQKSLKDNILTYIFPEGSYLSIEPELLLSDDFADPRTYVSILQAIGLGRTKFSQILQNSGMPASALPVYLQNLQALKLIKRETPVTDALRFNSKNSTYSLSDMFLRFYFSFILPNSSLIKSKAYEAVFKTKGEVLRQLVAKSYEDATGEFVREATKIGVLPHFELMGRWWDKETEIDLVGLNQETNSILFVETKWSNKLVGVEVLLDLKEKSKRVGRGKTGRTEYFGLVSKNGFSQELKSLAKKKGVVLIEENRVMV